MKTPQTNSTVSEQELMEYVDGLLPPSRRREVETAIAHSQLLQREVSVLRAINTTVQQETIVSPSKNFTTNLLKDIIPVQKESLLFRVVKNSSSVFAMVLVLSFIGILLSFDSNSISNGSSPIAKSFESYSVAYHSMVESISTVQKQITQPVNDASKTFSGKFLLFGLAGLIVFIVVDEVFGKRYFQARIKH